MALFQLKFGTAALGNVSSICRPRITWTALFVETKGNRDDCDKARCPSIHSELRGY